MKSIIRAICAASLGLLALQASARAEDTIEAIRSRGVLRIPGIINEDPYFNKDPRSGEWRGFAIEMARDIANTLGVKLEVVESSWPNSILDVQSGKADLALGVTATPGQILDPRVLYGDGHVHAFCGGAQERAFLADGFVQCDGQLRPHRRQHQPGKAGARAEVGQGQRFRRDQGFQLGTIQHVALPQVGQGASGHQIVPGVPVEQHIGIGLQLGQCFL